jgi:diguanylate cyclase (GGDEF)-like protein/excisionase family DNA binding protein
MATTGSNGQSAAEAATESMADEPWVGITVAAAHLALPVRTVYRLAQRGAVPAVKVGRTWRFKRSILDAHLGRGRAGDERRPEPDGGHPLIATVAALADLSVDLSGLRDAGEIQEVLASRLASIFEVDLVGLLRREGTDLVTVTATGALELEAGFRFDGRADPLTARIASSTLPIVLDDLGSVAAHPIVARFGIRSALFVPIQTSGGSWGVLTLATFRDRRFDPVEVDRLVSIAGQTGLALTNAALLAETARWSAQLERRLASQRQLLAITERLLVTRERDAVFTAVADTLADVVPHDTLTIYLVDRAAGCLVPVLARDAYAEQILATRPRLGGGITGHVIARGEAELINDATRDPRVVHVPGTPTEEDESMIVAPIHGQDGVVGSLNLYRTRRHFDDDDLELARLFTNHVAIALENAAIHERLLDAARSDPLTGLPNRRFFGQRVDQAIARRTRHGGRLAVLFLDLDGFKLVNDSVGHAAGDVVLTAVAERLREALRAEDTIARLGGDEFGILVEDVREQRHAVAVGRRLADSLAASIEAEGRRWTLQVSIGIAVDDDATASASDLLRDADTAMYRAKADGGGRIAVFTPSMHAAQVARLELDADLREARARDELSLRFQPIVDLRTGETAAVEALLRWEHPGRGTVLPSDFVPVAEETGQIVPIGAWVLEQACHVVAGWQRSGIAAESTRVSVNTSARQLVDPTFPAHVQRALRDSGLRPDRLVLEVTETVMLADETIAVRALRRLRDLGVHVAIDDFGTGYSSLGQLRRLPVDEIKIDRSFVDGLGTEREKVAIVRAAVALARALDLSVTAEGIETDRQLELVCDLGCAFGQGYRFARPLTVDAAAELLASGGRFELPAAGERGAPAA